MSLRNQKSILPLALSASFLMAAAPGNDVIPEVPGDNASVIQCIREHTEEGGQRAIQVMGSSEGDFQSITWILQEPTNAQPELQHYLAVQVRAVSYIPEMPTLWNENNLLFVNVDADGSIEGVKMNGTSQSMNDSWSATYDSILKNTLQTCAATASNPTNNPICPGSWTISREEQIALHGKIAPGIVGLMDSAGNFACSGARIEGDRVLTAEHCVANKEDLMVVWPAEENGNTRVYLVDAKVLKKDAEPDLALLQLPSRESATFFKVAPVEDVQGAPNLVQTMGHPNGRAWTLMTLPQPMTLDSEDGTPTEMAYLSSKPLCWDHGLSGAPLLNGGQEIVGVVVSENSDDSTVHIAGATAPQTIIDFLATQTPNVTVKSATKVCDLKRAQAGSILTNYGPIQIAQVDMASCVAL